MLLDVFFKAFFDLFHPRMILAVLVSLFFVLVCFLVLFFVSFSPISSWIENSIMHYVWAQETYQYFQTYFTFSLFPIITLLMMLLLFFPLTWFFAVFFINFISFPLVFNFLETRHSFKLERRGSFALAKSVKTTLFAFLSLMFFWTLSLPFWLFGIGPLLTFLILSRFNSKVFSCDSMVDYASKDEIKKILKENKLEYFLLGAMCTFMIFIPFLNFAAPILAALVFTRYTFMQLMQLRSSEVSVK